MIERPHAGLRRCLVLHPDVRGGGRVLAEQQVDEAGLQASLAELANALGHLRPDIRRDRLPVDDLRSHDAILRKADPATPWAKTLSPPVPRPWSDRAVPGRR